MFLRIFAPASTTFRLLTVKVCKQCRHVHHQAPKTLSHRLLSQSSGSSSDHGAPGPEQTKPADINQQQLNRHPDAQEGIEDSSSSSSSSSGSDSSSSDSDDEPQSVDAALVSATQQVAESLPGDAGQTQSELLRRLQRHASLTRAQQHGQAPPKSDNLSSLISGLRIAKDNAGKDNEEPRSRQQRARPRDTTVMDRLVGEKPSQRGNRDAPKPPRRIGKRTKAIEVKLFEGTPLGIFAPAQALQPTDHKPTLFSVLEKEEAEQQTNFPFTNAFGEQIQWTKEGKLWSFPIDNEQGMDEEASVGFNEHVFLDELLKDFPQKGPIRHFIELVVVGLSKNPYITVQQKHEHVAWFREYFKDKYKLLDDLMSAEEQ